MPTDEEFVRSLKRGDEDAYELLVRRFEASLYRSFLGSHGDSELAGEATLAALIGILAREPGPWVIGCGARNVNSGELVRG